MIALPRVAGRIFGEPLAIDRGKLDIIVAAIGPRLLGLPMEGPEDVSERLPVQIDSSGIACIDISGTLVAKASGMQAMSGLTSYSDIAAEFSAAMQNPSCRGVLLAIDSPGGEVDGMFDLADLMYGARGQKPICAAVSCAASAAYLLASCADGIVVSRTGITGSVGIIALHLDESKADEQAGLKYTAVYAGARKNDGNPHEPLSPEAKSGMQARVDTVYGMFVAAVSKYRGMTAAAVRKTEAGIYMGQDGVTAGFADAVGSPADAMALLGRAIQGGARSLTASSFVTSSAASAARKEPIMAETQAAEPKVPTPAEIEAMVTEARSAGFADASQIVSLCAIAGMPSRAAEFITARKSVADVSTALLAAKAEADEKLKLNPDLLPGGEKGKDGTSQGKAEPWGKVFKTLGIKTKEGK